MTSNLRSMLRAALVLFAVVALAAAVPVAAQGGPGGGRHGGPGPGPGGDQAFGAHRGGHGFHLGRFARFLDLTDEQIEAARAIFDAARDETAPVREAQRALHAELKALLDSASPDAAAVGELVLSLHANRQQVQAIHEAAFEDFKALLTAEQLAKLERLREVRRHFGAPRGPFSDPGDDA
jgi:Spy/CpxP family protein refolding chaperone